MNRTLLVGLSVLAAGAALWVGLQPAAQIRLSQASLSPVGGGTYMAGLVLENEGAPDRLVGARSPAFSDVRLMGTNSPVILPGGATPSLAADGVHLMLTGGAADADTLVPLELEFATAGTVSVRAKVSDMAMDHGAMSGVAAEGMTVRLVPPSAVTRDGFVAEVATEGLQMISLSAGSPHVAGQGHAHVYLNGLKLQRLYKPEFSVGALLPGRYVLRVSVNTNDHRPYLKDGVALADEWRFSVDSVDANAALTRSQQSVLTP